MPMPEESAAAKKITKDELILAELKGKNEAIGRYDTILWRVRSGYVVIFYGSLLLFADRNGGLVPLLENSLLVWVTILIIFVLSFILACMDIGFRFRQLKVVAAYDQLSDAAFALAAGGEDPKTAQDQMLRSLLHIAGESYIQDDRLKRIWAIILIGALYLVPPLLAFVAFTIIHGPW
jgi:hypothetical protein